MYLKINKSTDIHALLGEVEHFLADCNLEKIKKMEAHTIISEIIYNIKKYTPQGSIKLSVVDDILHISAIDSGKGIEDLHQSIKDGYSSGGTLGIGFASIFRLADEVDIETCEDGTKIEIQKRIK